MKALLPHTKKLRKVDLHTHLDGSVPLKFLLQHAGMESTSSAARQLQEAIWTRNISQYWDDTGAKGIQANTSLGVFDFMNSVLQSPPALREAAALISASNSEDGCVRVRRAARHLRSLPLHNYDPLHCRATLS